MVILLLTMHPASIWVLAGEQVDVGPLSAPVCTLKNLSTFHHFSPQPHISTSARTPRKTTAKMNAASTGLENMDLDRLNDKDKADLRQFLANEQQRSQIQSRSFSPCLDARAATQVSVYWGIAWLMNLTL